MVKLFIPLNLTSIFLTVILSLFISSMAKADKFQKYQTIDLRSCQINISADEFYINDRGTTFSGNVKILIGFANLRADKITLIRKKDGRCALVHSESNYFY